MQGGVLRLGFATAAVHARGGGGWGGRLSPPLEKVFWPDLAGFGRIRFIPVGTNAGRWSNRAVRGDLSLVTSAATRLMGRNAREKGRGGVGSYFVMA